MRKVEEKAMLEVTNETLTYLASALEKRKAPENISMRLSRRKTGLQIAPDGERLGDRGFDHDDRTVLLVGKSLAAELSGQKLCVKTSPSGHTEVRLEPAQSPTHTSSKRS